MIFPRFPVTLPLPISVQGVNTMNGNNSDKSLVSKKVSIEQKTFFFDIKENSKGRYVRITEVSGGRSAIVIPMEGAEDFRETFADILEQAIALD